MRGIRLRLRWQTIRIKFKLSAFKHDCTEADIRHALKHKIHAAPLVNFPEKYGVVGFDTRWNPIEVLITRWMMIPSAYFTR
jgi:hypothetical protein